MPSPELPVDRYLRSLHAAYADLRDGSVADYIPGLAAADPDRFAICIATVDGQVYTVGDAEVRFTIQSISKPFTYGLALEDQGLSRVLERIGVEPSGDAFNEISLDDLGRPSNPMINAGAIMSASLVAGEDPVARVLESYSTWAGRELAVDEDVYSGERDTGHRNRAITHMLRAVGTLEGDPERALDVYFRQCSVAVDTRDLAVMAATLAARGVNPVTGQRALSDEHVDHVLSVMTTCGMYDAAGEWLVDVGIPAKSGVGGGIIGVLPGQLGLAVFSPRLDRVGNSLRGVAVFRRLSDDLRLHFLNVGRNSSATSVTAYDLADVPSTRRRGDAERQVLDSGSHSAVVITLSGDVLFAGTEAMSRIALESVRRFVLLDLSRVGVVDVASARILAELARELRRQGGELVLAGAPEPTVAATGTRAFDDLDTAKEWCEGALLSSAMTSGTRTAVTLAEHSLCVGMTAEQTAALEALAEVREFGPGDPLVRAGDPATELFLLSEGEVEVSIATASGRRRRLSTLVPGHVFGESALTGQAVRTADVTGLTAGRCAVLATAALDAAPDALRAAVLAALLDIAHEALGRATREISALSR